MNRNVLTLGLLALIALTGGIIVHHLSILRSSNLTSISPASQQAAVSDFNSSLVAHYTFDDTANDASGNNNHGTVSGGATYVEGKIGRALSFDGVDDQVNAGQVFSSAPQAFTLSAWVKWNVSAGNTGIVGKRGVK